MSEKIASFVGSFPSDRYTEKQLLSIYHEYDTRYDYIDLHTAEFVKMEFMVADILENGLLGGLYQPGDPEYGIYLEQMNQPWHTQDELSNNMETRDWWSWRTQILEDAQIAHEAASP